MTNYAAWDAFDSDRAIEEVDQNNEILGLLLKLLIYELSSH